jgi:GTP-binding protein
MPEIAVAGRSNVGKSTLINALFGARLAKVAAAPGKTRSINFYEVEAHRGDAPPPLFRIVDLPGYGYAARSRSEQKEWSELISHYILNRDSLSLILHLVDLRHGLVGLDATLQQWLSELRRDFLVVFTKADKVPRGARQERLRAYVREGLRSVGMPLLTSASNGEGIESLRSTLVQWINGSVNDGSSL